MELLHILRSATYIVLLAIVPFVFSSNNSSSNIKDFQTIYQNKAQRGNGTALFLTPLINAGKLAEARRKSRVRNLSKYESYSGYFTVSKKYNRNLFFWFFPALNNKETAPVLLWLQGGPGATSLFGLFAGNGPFRITKNAKLKYHLQSWVQTHSVIYIDSPVGTGLSFTGEGGYRKSSKAAAVDLYLALIQFFTAFPDYALLDFYVTGESYAGKYVPALSRKIHLENRASPKLKINLKGFAMGNGWIDPVSYFVYGKTLYNVGLLDEKETRHFQREEKAAKKEIRKRNWLKAFEIMDVLITQFLVNSTYFTNVTGYTYYYNLLKDKQPAYESYYEKFIEKSRVRRAIHVGSEVYHGLNNLDVTTDFRVDIFMTAIRWLIELLDAPEGYRVLIYNGNLDLIVPTVGVEAMLRKMRWSGLSKYAEAPKKFWMVGDILAGYVRRAKNLTFLVVRNAGHVVPFDQPENSLDMINRFTSGKKFS